MDLITTHMNADFDALGSLVAAKKLYPASRLLLPGSQEEAVREFLLLAKDDLAVETERSCRLDDVDRLILVDTRHRSRIGIAAELVDKGIEIIIYDHHPRMKGDIVADTDVYEEIGATVSMLAEIIKRKKIKLSYLEATIMLLGIYEETGSLTYRTTTKLDVDMVSFLLLQGANLSVVSSYLNRELNEEELSLLTRLLNSTERVVIKGVHITFIELDSDSYIGELGKIIQKIMEIENIPVLFIFVKTNRGRIDIIGRSNIPSVDTNKILSAFGGGGHPGASSAKVHGIDMGTIRGNLEKALRRNIKIKLTAEDIMSRSFKTISSSIKITEAKKLIEKLGIGGLPVAVRGKITGAITYDSINKAIKKGFGHSKVKGYMSSSVSKINYDTPLYAIQKKIAEKDASIILVLKGKKTIGLINRTDVLKNVHDDLFLKPHRPQKKTVLNINKKMKALLPSDIMALLGRIGKMSDSLGYSAFVVGGLVRDLMLNRPNLDLDIVVEGDAIRLGQLLAAALRASLVVHKRFGTCSVVTRERLKIDLATARKEVYEKPAALPTVEFSSLKNDLIRRDFTINAMAVSINPSSFGQLIDFFGGQRDLARGCIKVLHDASFIDDPTRIFRAVRFEQRFGFRIESVTEELIKNAVEEDMFEKVHPQRIRDEIILILKEPEPLKALKRMDELHELRFIHPGIKLDKALASLYKRIGDACRWYGEGSFKKRNIDEWLIYMMALFRDLSYNETSKLCRKFAFRRGDCLRILSYNRCSKYLLDALGHDAAVSPSSIYRVLDPLSFEVLLLMMASSDNRIAVSRIKDFFEKYNGRTVSIKGDDLKAMGLSPCPDFKAILRKVLYAKLDGLLSTRKDELSYARQLVKRRCN